MKITEIIPFKYTSESHDKILAEKAEPIDEIDSLCQKFFMSLQCLKHDTDSTCGMNAAFEYSIETNGQIKCGRSQINGHFVVFEGMSECLIQYKRNRRLCYFAKKFVKFQQDSACYPYIPIRSGNNCKKQAFCTRLSKLIYL